MPSPQPMGAADAAWLHMERPNNLMVINGVFEVEGEMTLGEVRTLVSDRLLRFPRFGERIVDPDSSHPRWVPDPSFELARHVRIEPAVTTDAERRSAVERHLSEPLPLHHPPWAIHVLPAGENTLLLCRVHHCMADGMALIRVLLTIADEHDESEVVSDRGWGRSVWRAVRAATQPLRQLREGLSLLRTTVSLAIRPADPPTPLRGPVSTAKRVAWSGAFDLATVKRIAHARDAKINDVLTAAVAGALRRFVQASGGQPQDIRAMVPVNLRPLDRAAELGNYFGLVMLPLPLGEADVGSRVSAVRRRMDRAKGAREAAATFAILRGLGLLNRRLEAPFLRFFGAKVSAVMTNVPGPRTRLHMRGHAVRWIMFWVPQSGALALGISVLSYAGSVLLGVMCDANVIGDPGEITRAFEDELAELARRLGTTE